MGAKGPRAPRAAHGTQATQLHKYIDFRYQIPEDSVGLWAQDLGYLCQLSLGDDTLEDADLVDCRVDRVWGEGVLYG